MIKIVVLIKKKAGLTTAQFRSHYENSHAQLAMLHFGHLFVEYRRNYPVSISSFTARDSGRALDVPEETSCGYDVITEIVLRDQAALDEFMAILERAEIARLFSEDEERFADRAASRFTICEVEQSQAYIQWMPTRKTG